MGKKLFVLLGLLALAGKIATAQDTPSLNTGVGSFDYLDNDRTHVSSQSPTYSAYTDNYTYEFYDSDGNDTLVDTVSAQGEARASYGDLGAEVSFNNNYFQFSKQNVNEFLEAGANSTDYITIAGVAGDKGTLYINIGLEGSSASDDGAVLIPYTDFFVSGPDAESLFDNELNVHTPGNYTSTGITFTFGVPFMLHMSLDTELDYPVGIAESPGPDVSAYNHFLDTAAWTGSTVVDTTLNKTISNPSIIGSSGTTYPKAVPEPGTTTLLLVGAGGLIFALRRRALAI